MAQVGRMAIVLVVIMRKPSKHMPLVPLNVGRERVPSPVRNAMPLAPKRCPQQGPEQQDIQPARQA
jgi:hypothetical protein